MIYSLYGIDAFGWSTTTSVKALGVPRIANLGPGDATGIDINML